MLLNKRLSQGTMEGVFKIKEEMDRGICIYVCMLYTHIYLYIYIYSSQMFHIYTYMGRHKIEY